MAYNILKYKGFTIVELVIVIAVIAILASVLIPTFSTLLESAHESSARQVATNALKQYVLDNPNARSFEDDGQMYYVAYFSKTEGCTTYHFRCESDGSLTGIAEDDLPNFSAGWLKMSVYESQDSLPTSIDDTSDSTSGDASALYYRKLTTGESIVYYQTQPDTNGLSSTTVVFDMGKTFWVLVDEYYAETAVGDIDFAASAQDSDDSTITIDSQGVRYKSNGDGTAQVIGSDGTNKDIVIADVSPYGDRVTSVSSFSFYMSSIESIALGKNVTTIERKAFYGSSQLKSVALNEGLLEIRESAFNNCSSLSSILLPSSLQKLASESFNACSALASITIPANCKVVSGALPLTVTVKFAGGGTEYTASGYTYRLIDNCLTSEKSGHPESKTLLWAKAETSQSDIVIPADQNITTIGSRCLAYGSFASLTIPDSVTTLEEYALYACSTLTHIYGGSGLTTIKKSAIGYCKSLKQIDIPASLVSIDNYALSGCSSLDLTINSTLLLNNNVSGLHSFSLTTEMEAQGYRVENGCLIKEGNGTGDTIIAASVSATIPNDGKITAIASGAFGVWQGAENLTIPDSITTIEDNVFNGSSKVKNITLGVNITHIGDSFLSYCNSIEMVNMSCNITELGANTLRSATRLKTLTLPGTITKVGEGSFNNCSKLVDIYFGGTRDAWRAIDFPASWDESLPAYTVHCTDGDLVAAK